MRDDSGPDWSVERRQNRAEAQETPALEDDVRPTTGTMRLPSSHDLWGGASRAGIPGASSEGRMDPMSDRIPILSETLTDGWGWTCPWCKYDHYVDQPEECFMSEEVCSECDGRVLLCVYKPVIFTATPYQPCAQVATEN